MIVTLPDSAAPGRTLAQALGGDWVVAELRLFNDGEFKVRPTADPAGRHCIVLARLDRELPFSPQDRLCVVLFLIAALRDHRAARVDLITPYLPYARKDRRTQPLDPVSLRYLAQLLEAVGTDSVSTIEVHQPAAFDNAFRRPARALPGHQVLGAAALECLARAPDRSWVVASPDPGGIKRAQLWREMLERSASDASGNPSIEFAMIDKRRSLNRVSGLDQVAGEVRDRAVLVVDDLLVSGDTLARAAEALRKAGAARLIAAVCHDLSGGSAWQRLAAAGFDTVLTSDTVASLATHLEPGSGIALERVSCIKALTALALELVQ
jgi:ribose-phosphate pyrophosphokinase